MTLTKVLTVAGLVVFSGVAHAATFSGAGAPALSTGPSLIEKTHGDHRHCEEGNRGWHRHNRYGERLPCRPQRVCKKDWHCVKTGPFGIEKRCFWRDLCN